MNIKRHDYKKEEVNIWFKYVSNLMPGANIIRTDLCTQVRTNGDESKLIALWDHNGFGFIIENRDYNLAGQRSSKEMINTMLGN